MKIELLIVTAVLLICLVPYSQQEPNQQTELAASQTWQDEYQPEEYRGEKEEENAEEEPVRRPRGKRRRRMRKRQRAQVADEVDRVSNADQNPEATYERALSEDEGVTPADVPRRRPGKRRRRPYRRYQDDDGAPVKPLRRRRKGGRKKVRPENQDELSQTESPQEQSRNDEPNDTETTTEFIRTTASTFINSVAVVQNSNANTQEEEKPTVIPKLTTTTTMTSTTTTTKPYRKEDPQDIKVASNAVKTENEDNGKTFGSKIFDRKKLFSSPRRALPVTSAIIRKLGPNNKANASDSLTPQVEAKEKLEPKLIDRPVVRINSLTDGTTNLPKEIRPEKLVHNENKIQKFQEAESIENEDEEPNYPKIIPRPIFYRTRKPFVETTTYATTEITETTSQPVRQYETHSVKKQAMSEIEFEKDVTPMPEIEIEKLPRNTTMTETEFEKMLENLDVGSFNLTDFDDFILDLIQTKSGKEHLSKILESRNMTISQLLEHRERGSSKFHLFEMFPQKKATSTTQATTTTKATEKTATGKETQEIQFPSEDVLGSFPKFVTEEIAKHEQKNGNKITETETEGTINRESREPRLFDSMPEFTTLSITSTTKDDKHPTWRVIPNPKLRPVSVRGNYHEIPISHVLNRPLENNVNDIYIVDEREAMIHHKKFGLDTAKTKEGFGNFKRIPVGVKSAIIISGIILAVATFGFLSLLISCRVRQKKSILKAKQDMMCEHLQNDDFMTSQQSLSPVLTKHQQAYAHPHQEHHSHPHNRHYYLWRTIRRTFRYE